MLKGLEGIKGIKGTINSINTKITTCERQNNIPPKRFLSESSHSMNMLGKWQREIKISDGIKAATQLI